MALQDSSGSGSSSSANSHSESTKHSHYEKAIRAMRLPDEAISSQLDEHQLPRLTSEAVPENLLIVFCNRKSGGNRGTKLLGEFRKVLHEAQVYDIIETKPEHVLSMFGKANKKFRILVCGGDGTVAWVLSALDATNLHHLASTSILPLGTGNDLARVLGWGAGYDGANIQKIIHQVHQAVIQPLDRWDVKIKSSEGDDKCFVLNNYFSVGMSAHVALKFHEARDQNPSLYQSRTINKAAYFVEGLTDSVNHSCRNLHTKLKIYVNDNEEVTAPPFEEIIALNIPSYAGGMDLWKAGEKADQSNLSQELADRRIELLSVTGSFQMGQIKLGLSTPSRLSQCGPIRMVFHEEEELPWQVDGEPSTQRIKEVLITHRNQAAMLRKAEKKSGNRWKNMFNNVFH